MATPQETEERPTRSHRRLPRVRKFARSKFVKIPAAILAVGAILLIFPRVAPMLVSPINGGTAFGVALVVACAIIIRDHHRLQSNWKQSMLWWIGAGFATFATVTLSYYDNRVEPFMGHLALFPLLLLMVVAFYRGILFTVRFRKHESATYTGYLYLVAATLMAVVTTKLAMWFGPPFLYFYGEQYQQLSIVLFLLAVGLLMYAVARRPDLVYDDEDETPDQLDDSTTTPEVDDGTLNRPDPYDEDGTFHESDPTGPVSLPYPPLPAQPTSTHPETDLERTGPIVGTPVREPQPTPARTTTQWPDEEQPDSYPADRGVLS